MASFLNVFAVAALSTVLTLVISIPWLLILYSVPNQVWQVFAYIMIAISGEASVIFTYERSKEIGLNRSKVWDKISRQRLHKAAERSGPNSFICFRSLSPKRGYFLEDSILNAVFPMLPSSLTFAKNTKKVNKRAW